MAASHQRLQGLEDIYLRIDVYVFSNSRFVSVLTTLIRHRRRPAFLLAVTVYASDHSRFVRLSQTACTVHAAKSSLGLGYTGPQANLLTIPPYVFGFCTTLIVAAISYAELSCSKTLH